MEHFWPLINVSQYYQNSNIHVSSTRLRDNSFLGGDFLYYYKYVFSPNALFSCQKENLRKLPIMYIGSTLVYHATLGAND